MKSKTTRHGLKRMTALLLAVVLLGGGVLLLWQTGFFSSLGSLEKMRAYIDRFAPFSQLFYFFIQFLSVVAAPILAHRLERYNIDGVIAEGTESGGHVGETTTMALVPQVVDAVDIPVIAAGGIVDGRGMLAAFALGAEGVQCGTRFLTVEECGVHEAWKEKVLKAKDSDTIVTGRGTGHPVRGLKNKFARECRKIEMAATSGEELEGMYAGSLARAVAGDVENGSVMAGQGAAVVTERGPAAEVIANMVREAEALAGRSLGELAELNSRRARV